MTGFVDGVDSVVAGPEVRRTGRLHHYPRHAIQQVSDFRDHSQCRSECCLWIRHDAIAVHVTGACGPSPSIVAIAVELVGGVRRQRGPVWLVLQHRRARGKPKFSRLWVRLFSILLAFVPPSWLYFRVHYVWPRVAVLLRALRLSPARQVSIALAMLSSIASIYTLEASLGAWRAYVFDSSREVMGVVLDSRDKPKEAAALRRDWGVSIDTRSGDEMLQLLRKEFGDAVPNATPHNHMFATQPDGSVKSALMVDGQEVMPIAGPSSKMILMCNEGGQWISYKSDRRGFNNSDAVWSRQLQIAAVGDSFAQGYCVQADRSFVALVRDRYPATLNLGLAGNGPLLMLAGLSEVLPRFRPKIVLWFYFEGNDLIDLQGERNSALLKAYLNDGFRQPALARQQEIDGKMLQRVAALRALSQASRARQQQHPLRNVIVPFITLQTLRETLRPLVGVDRVERERLADLSGPNIEIFGRTLARAKERVASWDGELVFVYLPDWTRYSSRQGSPETRLRDRVLSLTRGLGIRIVDLCPPFEASGDPLSFFPFRRNGHYNEAGHQLVAEEVLKVISPGVSKRDARVALTGAAFQ